MARPWRLFGRLVLGVHTVAAAGVLWPTPGGFPWTHPRTGLITLAGTAVGRG